MLPAAHVWEQAATRIEEAGGRALGPDAVGAEALVVTVLALRALGVKGAPGGGAARRRASRRGTLSSLRRRERRARSRRAAGERSARRSFRAGACGPVPRASASGEEARRFGRLVSLSVCRRCCSFPTPEPQAPSVDAAFRAIFASACNGVSAGVADGKGAKESRIPESARTVPSAQNAQNTSPHDVSRAFRLY